MHRTAIVIKLSSLARFKFIVMTNDWPGSTWPVGSSPQFLCTWHDALMVSTLSRLKSYKSAILSAADWRSRSAHDLRHESVMNDDVHVMKSMTPGSVFSRGQCGVMRVITWIMAPTDHCYWPFLLPVSRSPPCLDQLATDCLLTFLGLVSRIVPGAQRSAWAWWNQIQRMIQCLSLLLSFIFLLITSTAFILISHTSKRNLNLNPSRETKSVHFLVSMYSKKNVVMFYFYLIGEKPPRQSIFGQQNKLTIETM